MTAATFVLLRHEDVSGVSGTGVVCEGVEFSDGAVAVRWLGSHPSTTAWADMRDMEATHGHGGKTVVQYSRPERLLASYALVMPFILTAREGWAPIQCSPHPDHPDRLRLIFTEERVWRWWVALLDGSTDAAVQEDIGGETEHRWTSPFGDIWLVFHTRHAPTATAWEMHDDPEMNR